MHLIYIKVQSSMSKVQSQCHKSEALFAIGLDHCVAVRQASGMIAPSLGGNVKQCQKNVQKRSGKH